MKGKLFFGKLLALALLSLPHFLSAQVTETRNVSGFSAIEASSVFDITVNKSATESLVIEADEKIMPYVRTEVKNGVLKLYLDKNKVNNIKTLKATIGVKELKVVKLSGACKLRSSDIFNAPKFDIQLSGACAVKLSIKTDKLKVDASGASNLDLIVETRVAQFDASGASNFKMQLKAEKVAFNMSGSCKAEVKGVADEADFGLSGACTIKTNDLICKTVSVKTSGSSNLTLNVSERLGVSSSGASVVTYKGRPVVNINTSGSSKVKSID